MHSGKFANLGCGPVFIDEDNWVNLDYEPTAKKVIQADLLQTLPLASSSFDGVYSSHFIEHIPIDLVDGVLTECLRILKPGGVLRLVTPDLEEMCKSYIRYRQESEHVKANFLVVEMIDQTVRRYPGGELGKLFREYSSDQYKHKDMVEFLRYRTGETLTPPDETAAKNERPTSERVLKSISRRIESLRSWVGIKILPGSFIRQNVSFASVGEKHHWLWDYEQLEHRLEKVGFEKIHKVTHDTSQIEGFPCFPLDIDPSGDPRKGVESMYVEAMKSSTSCMDT